MIKYLLPFFFTFSVFAETNSAVSTLDDLMKLVQTEKIEQKEELKKREAQFLKEKNEQQRLLNQAQSELASLEKVRKKLINEYNKHEEELKVLNNELQIVISTLGDIFGVVKQVSGEFLGNLSKSVVSAELKDRKQFLQYVVDQKKQPNIKELRRLWLELQLEMTELGQVRKFDAQVVLEDGTKVKRTITRVGGFNLVSNGEYLTYQDDTSQITELSKQPQGSFLRPIKKLEGGSGEKEYPFFVDPSRGALLSIELRKPTQMDRVRQGGIIGYIIILFLFVGLGIGGYRFIVLRREELKMQQQLIDNKPSEDNPLGRLRLAFEQTQNMEVLEIKLEEIIAKSLPILEKGIGWIRILAAVAPLCGLLGTVLGMIETFQSIQLFGTGDPKMMASGISMALVTTALGLICAIPLLFLHTVISNKSANIIQTLEEQAAGLIAKKTSKGE